MTVRVSKPVQIWRAGGAYPRAQGWDIYEVEVIELSEPASPVRLKPENSMQRPPKVPSAVPVRPKPAGLLNQTMQHPLKRPDKKQRRDIQRFQRQPGE